ncbi:MAG: hypothetical protein K6D97_06805 [Clostridia bacterium]|nr:hypothetical protein [Clostridia bacterium]
MDKQVTDISNSFNERIRRLDPRKLKLYMDYMGYLIALNHLKKEGSDRIDEFKQGCYQKARRDFPEIINGAANFDEIEQNVILSIKDVLILIQDYKNSIKKYYQDNGLNLYTVRGHKYDVVKRSQNALNQFENESGNWVFATSTPKEHNFYRMRNSSKGMFSRRELGAIYLGNNTHVKSGRLLLNSPQYFYTLKNDKFMPVVRIKNAKDNPSEYYIDFSNEWTSDQDITEEDIVSIEEYIDVTDLVDNNDIFGIDDSHADTFKSLSRGKYDGDFLRKTIKEEVGKGTITYFNYILGRNVDAFYAEGKALHDATTPDSH